VSEFESESSSAAPLDPRDTFALGVCYYPEHWPRDRWEGYAGRMRELGLGYVRIAEFAWSRMEPRPGEFDWGWLDDAIDVLHEAELKVVLCTPTATPPAWLVRAHPEILPWDAAGRVRDHGSRKHYDHASPVYRAHSRRITEAIAGRYGQHPAVVGWQTDNEFGCHATTRSYGPASQAAFREWLERRYGTLDALNAAWGNVFWSQEYTDWSQINPPGVMPAQLNPSHVLDFFRFASDTVVAFQEEQVAILRRRSPGRWVTHNFMGHFSEFDHFKAAEGLDFATWDSYPLGHLQVSHLPEAEKVRWARTGHPDLVSWNHDLYRGLTARNAFWVMEQGAGQVNWAPYNPLPVAGAVALWTAQAYAHGADVVSYFRWRAATVAQELMHSGLLRHDETLDRGGEEIAALELPGRPNGPVAAPVVVLHDYESLWVQDAQPHAATAIYWPQLMLFYGALRALGVDVDVRHPDADLSGYKLVVAPALQIVGEERAANLERAAREAIVLFGPRAGYRTPTGRVHEDGQPGPLRGLLGCRLRNFDSLPPGLAVHAGGHAVETWAESYEPIASSARVLTSIDDGPLAGQAVVVRNNNAVVVGAWSASLVGELLAALLAEAGVPVTPLPDGVRVARRGEIVCHMNFNQEAVTLADGTLLGPVSYQVGGQDVRS
jgi:beta-galactosidase